MPLGKGQRPRSTYNSGCITGGISSEDCTYSLMIFTVKELAMQFSHFNNGSLALTYLTNLPRPYDFELFFTKYGA